MTEADLMRWALDHYFAAYEVEQAQTILNKSGKGAAVDYLKGVATSSQRGSGGPGRPSLETRSGKIGVRQPGTSYSQPADLEVDIGSFCRQKVESLHQVRMF